MVEVIELSIEHILLFIVIVFLLYYLMGSCGCRNGFRVGGQPSNDYIPNPNNIPSPYSSIPNTGLMNCNEIKYNDNSSVSEKISLCNSYSDCVWNPFLETPGCTTDCNNMKYNDNSSIRDKISRCNSFSHCEWNAFLTPSRCTYKKNR